MALKKKKIIKEIEKPIIEEKVEEKLEEKEIERPKTLFTTQDSSIVNKLEKKFPIISITKNEFGKRTFKFNATEEEVEKILKEGF